MPPSLPSDLPPNTPKVLLQRQAFLFLLALGFLTRLAPARAATDKDMGDCCLYYPLVGIVLGSLVVLPLWLGVFSGKPWIQAWLYVGCLLWLTRALHHDGLADLLDALGSGKTGDAFWKVLKDSRIGAFGTVGLIMLVAGQIFCAADNLEYGRVAPLIYAPLFGRCLPVFLALAAPVSPTAGLGRLLANGQVKTAAGISSIALMAGGFLFLELLPFICSLGLGAVLLAFMAHVARTHGGYNGDFFGALIVCGESAVLLSSCL